MRDLPLVTFQGAPSRTLTTEFQTAQQMPDMARMIGHPRQILNQESDARQRPKIGPVTARDRPLQQSVDNLAMLVCVEARLAACRTFADQRGTTALKPSALPTRCRLATDPDTPCHIRRRITLVKHDG